MLFSLTFKLENASLVILRHATFYAVLCMEIKVVHMVLIMIKWKVLSFRGITYH